MRLPSAMLASTRCRPHVGSGDGCSSGELPNGVTCSTLAPFSDEHFARYAFRYSTHGVAAVIGGKPSRLTTCAMMLGANGSVGRIDVTFPAPPRSEAGFVHSTSTPG